MLRIVVRELDGPVLPAIDVEDELVIGGGAAARIRLPASVAKPEHVRIRGGRWTSDDGDGSIGDGVELAIGNYRIAIAPAPDGVAATSPQRTASLARELLRGVLGDKDAPALEIVDGPFAGTRRQLAPPESVLAIGRGVQAGWQLADAKLSRLHAEVRRGWDGIRVVDAGSASGTWVDDCRVSDALLRDGEVIRVGATRIRFSDPASRNEHPSPSPSPSPTPSPTPSPSRTPIAPPPRWQLYAAVAVISAAVAAALWVAIT